MKGNPKKRQQAYTYLYCCNRYSVACMSVRGMKCERERCGREEKKKKIYSPRTSIYIQYLYMINIIIKDLYNYLLSLVGEDEYSTQEIKTIIDNKIIDIDKV